MEKGGRLAGEQCIRAFLMQGIFIYIQELPLCQEWYCETFFSSSILEFSLNYWASENAREWVGSTGLINRKKKRKKESISRNETFIGKWSIWKNINGRIWQRINMPTELLRICLWLVTPPTLIMFYVFQTMYHSGRNRNSSKPLSQPA